MTRDLSVIQELSIVLVVFAAGGFLGKEVERTNQVARSKPKDLTGWDAMEDFGDSDQLILGDDGEQAHYIPMTPPSRFKDQWKNDRAEIIVVRCGDDEIADPSEWVAQSRRMGKREFNSYKALARDREGKVMLLLRRKGERDSTKTRYGIVFVRDVEPNELASCQALLADYEKANR